MIGTMSAHRMHLLVPPLLLAQLDAAAERDRPGAANRSGTAIRLLARALALESIDHAPPPQAPPAPIASPIRRRVRWPRSRGSAASSLETGAPQTVDGVAVVVVELEPEVVGEPLFVWVVDYAPPAKGS